MEGQGEAAADVITGGVIARAIEPTAGEAKDHAQEHGQCRNCGATVTGSYCSNCGQPTHLHRSLVSLGHDILHGVFHFEGKVWHTIPELLFFPGRLTRRYIDGERAKFVSPMALYLFIVFLMFAVIPFTGSEVEIEGTDPLGVAEQFKENIGSQIEKLNEQIETKREQLSELEPAAGAERKKIEDDIAGLIAAREAQQAMISGDWRDMVKFAQEQEAKAKAQAKTEAPQIPGVADKIDDTENRFKGAIQKATENPALLAYKLKTTGYKFSWALIPLSVPFMWLLFFWRRDIHAYDHAIFVTYSISFMMLFAVIVTLLYDLGVSAWIWGTAIGILPPLHLYKQLRGAYGISRFGAWVRLFLLSIMITFVLTMFGLILVAIGMRG
jgi:ribosomal protein L37E